MVGSIKQSSSSSNMLRYLLPHYFFLVLALVSRPASATYKVVLESGSAQDNILIRCFYFKGDNEPISGGSYVDRYIEVGRPFIANFESWERVICHYEYQHNEDEWSNFILFDGDKPDQDCRAELGGCTFIITDAVMYKKLRGGGTRLLGDVRALTCKIDKVLWLFNVKICKETPHQHPYVWQLA